MKNTIAEMKNKLEGIKNRLDDTEEWISELEDRVVETTEPKQTKIVKNEEKWRQFKRWQHEAY